MVLTNKHCSDSLGGMNILDHAITAAGGVTNLAKELGVRQNVVSNWRLRKRVPLPWQRILLTEYSGKKPAAKQRRRSA